MDPFGGGGEMAFGQPSFQQQFLEPVGIVNVIPPTATLTPGIWNKITICEVNIRFEVSMPLSRSLFVANTGVGCCVPPVERNP